MIALQIPLVLLGLEFNLQMTLFKSPDQTDRLMLEVRATRPRPQKLTLMSNAWYAGGFATLATVHLTSSQGIKLAVSSIKHNKLANW